MRRTVRCAAIVVGGVALLGACSSSSPKTSSSNASGSTTTRASTASGNPQSFAELESRIVTEVPAEFVEQPPGAFDSGPSDLAKAIRDNGGPDAGKNLRAEKFVRGYQRIWTGPEHAQIIVFVYQFETVAGARQDFARMTSQYSSEPPPGARRFVVPGLPPERAVGIAGADKDSAAAIVYFTKGVYNVQINCNAPRQDGLQARAVALAKAQAARL